MKVKSLRNTSPIHILVADNQETDAFFIEQAFGQSRIANIVHRVKDGQEAIDFLKHVDPYKESPRPSIIILDIEMPGKNGYETLTEIKNDQEFCDIPVIIMLGLSGQGDVNKAYKHRANAYIPKNNGFEDMLGFVNAVENFWFIQARLPDNDV